MKKCPMCGEEPKARKGGLCAACISWWNRVNTYSSRELATYAEGFGLRLRRMEGRQGRVSRLGRGRRRAA
jgi:hypothetical protein